MDALCIGNMNTKLTKFMHYTTNLNDGSIGQFAVLFVVAFSTS